MKKFSVIVVAMLIALMLLSGCSNKINVPDQPDSIGIKQITEEDLEVIRVLKRAVLILEEQRNSRNDMEVRESDEMVQYIFHYSRVQVGRYFVTLNGDWTLIKGNEITTIYNFKSGTYFMEKEYTLWEKSVTSLSQYEVSTDTILNGYRMVTYPVTPEIPAEPGIAPEEPVDPEGEVRKALSADADLINKTIKAMIYMTQLEEDKLPEGVTISPDKSTVFFNNAYFNVEDQGGTEFNATFEGTVSLTFQVYNDDETALIYMLSSILKNGTMFNGEAHTLTVLGNISVDLRTGNLTFKFYAKYY